MRNAILRQRRYLFRGGVIGVVKKET